jgi:hypothetical protein
MTIEQAMKELYQRHILRYRWYPGMRVQLAEFNGRILAGGVSGGIQLVEWENSVNRKTWSPGDHTDGFKIDIDDFGTVGVLHGVAEELYRRPLELRYHHRLQMWAVKDDWAQMGPVMMTKGAAIAEVIKIGVVQEEPEP